MKWKRAVAVLLLCGLLQGCGLAPSFADPERSAGKIVLQVSVEAMPADTAWDRVYTEPVKIEAILDYIQALHTVPPETGEQEVKEEATCKITLHYSAGADKVYYMAGESYLREGEANWMRLEAHPEISLREILRENQSDLMPSWTAPFCHRTNWPAPRDEAGQLLLFDAGRYPWWKHWVERLFYIILGLGVPQGSIEALCLQEGFVAAPLHQPALLEDQDILAEPAAAHAVGDIDAGFVPDQLVKAAVDFIFAEGVQGSGGFIQDHEGGVLI